MALTDRFSPFGLVLFGVLLAGLLFFAYLMTSRGNNPNGSEPTDGYTDEAAPVNVPDAARQ